MKASMRKQLDKFCTCDNSKPMECEGCRINREQRAATSSKDAPYEAIASILNEVMGIAVSNGANSISMPGEYVEVALWLCNQKPSAAIASQKAKPEGEPVGCVPMCELCLERGFDLCANLVNVNRTTPQPAVTLDFKQATELLAMFGGEPSEITLLNGDGHSGKGLYAHYSDYPEEGAEYFGVSDDEATPDSAKPVPHWTPKELESAKERADQYADWFTGNTTPQPVAEGDAKDAERLDWLLHNLSGKALRDVKVIADSGGLYFGRIAVDRAIASQKGAA